MRVFRTLDDLPPFRNAVLTIGTFDGVHFGHQQIIKRIAEIAERHDGESVLLTFHPHPRLVINPADQSLKLLTTLEEKLELLEKYGLDNVIVVPFSRNFSEQPAEEYIRDVLVGSIHPAVIVIGYNHRFGKDRSGGIELLREVALKYHYDVEEIAKQEVDDLSVSSTKVRTAIQSGDISLANQLLGHPFSIRGLVIKGRQIGRTIGYPTANIQIDEPYKIIPADGVYAVMVKCGDHLLPGMMSIGFNPTVDGKQRSIEVHIFDFERDIYGEKIEIKFAAKLRNEEKFHNLEALVERMRVDEAESKKLLSSLEW